MRWKQPASVLAHGKVASLAETDGLEQVCLLELYTNKVMILLHYSKKFAV
jgi:hypothetical protein